jgi:hypothetical protein
VVGGSDEAISPAQYDAVSTAGIGTYPEGYPARALPGKTVGAYRTEAGPQGPVRSIVYDQSLNEGSAHKVVAHEIGHMIDDLAGKIPTAGLSNELKPLYNTLNTGQERSRNLSRPRHFGYADDDIPREYIAEAIRVYMADPNYIKTVAPKTAARIRQFVNSNPRLKKVSEPAAKLADILRRSGSRSGGDAARNLCQPVRKTDAQRSGGTIAARDRGERGGCATSGRAGLSEAVGGPGDGWGALGDRRGGRGAGRSKFVAAWIWLSRERAKRWSQGPR